MFCRRLSGPAWSAKHQDKVESTPTRASSPELRQSPSCSCSRTCPPGEKRITQPSENLELHYRRLVGRCWELVSKPNILPDQTSVRQFQILWRSCETTADLWPTVGSDGGAPDPREVQNEKNTLKPAAAQSRCEGDLRVRRCRHPGQSKGILVKRRIHISVDLTQASIRGLALRVLKTENKLLCCLTALLLPLG